MDLTKVKIAANRFYIKHYPDILNCLPEEKDALRGKLHELMGTTLKHIEFFDAYFGKDYEDTGEYGAFTTELFGIGINKFRYNETNMQGFDHFKCKTLTDVAYYKQKIQHVINQENKDHPITEQDGFDENDFLEFINIWIYVTKGDGINIPYAINDLCSHAYWYFENIAYDYADSLMKPTKIKGPQHGLVDPESGNIYYNIEHSFEDSTVGKMESDMLFDVSQIANDFAYKINDHFSAHPVVFHQLTDDPSGNSVNTVVIPNVEAGNKIDMLNFYESLETSGYDSTAIIDDYAATLIDEMKVAIKDKFNELYHKHKNSTSIDTHKGGLSIMMPKGMFEEIDDEKE